MATDDAWSGVSQPVVPLLIARIREHSPELVLQIQEHLKRNDEHLLHRRTYDGTDASARLAFALIEALLSFEQIRMELLEQTDPSVTPIVPAHLMLAASEALQIEPALLHIAKAAFQMHLYCWNAHDVEQRLSAAPEEEAGD